MVSHAQHPETTESAGETTSGGFLSSLQPDRDRAPTRPEHDAGVLSRHRPPERRLRQITAELKPRSSIKPSTLRLLALSEESRTVQAKTTGTTSKSAGWWVRRISVISTAFFCQLLFVGS